MFQNYLGKTTSFWESISKSLVKVRWKTKAIPVNIDRKAEHQEQKQIVWGLHWSPNVNEFNFLQWILVCLENQRLLVILWEVQHSRSLCHIWNICWSIKGELMLYLSAVGYCKHLLFTAAYFHQTCRILQPLRLPLCQIRFTTACWVQKGFVLVWVFLGGREWTHRKTDGQEHRGDVIHFSSENQSKTSIATFLFLRMEL